MPTQIIYWRCDLCGQRHDSKRKALACEAQPLASVYPVGLIVTDSYHAGVKYLQVLARRGDRADRDHVSNASYWTFRDSALTGEISSIGDAAPDSRMTAGPLLGDEVYFRNPRAIDPSTARYRRMYAALTAAGIEPTVWDGTKAVPAPRPA